MCRVVTAVVALALLALTLGGCGDGGKSAASATDGQPETTSDTVVVAIGDNFYKPAKVTIREGQAITWRNTGKTAHTVTSDARSDVTFDSGTLDPGGSWGDLRLAAGTYGYYCVLHGKTQSGTITVTPR